MTVEFKMDGTGVYPTYLNVASSGGISHCYNIPSVEYVDLSTVSNTYIIDEQSIEINNNDIIVKKEMN